MTGAGRGAQRGTPAEAGYAMVSMLLVVTFLTTVLTVTLTYAGNSGLHARKSQDRGAAVAAAHAGVEYYLSRLHECPTFWRSPCSGTAPPPAWVSLSPPTTEWVPVPGAAGATLASFRYSVLSTPADSYRGIRLRSTGRINGVEGSLTVDLQRSSFLDYVYYSDKEALDPDLIRNDMYPPRRYRIEPPTSCGVDCEVIERQRHGVSAAHANRCAAYWYGTSAAPGRAGRNGNFIEVVTDTQRNPTTGAITYRTYNVNVGRNCDIRFGAGDIIDGRLYTKDAILISNSSSGGKPWFQGPVQTYWQSTGVTPAADPAKPWRAVRTGDAPVTDQQPSFVPEITAESVDLPPTNGALRNLTVPGALGCLYTGPTSVVMRADGLLDVHSPHTPAANPGCGSFPSDVPQTISLPGNGVLFVDPLPAGTSCKPGRILGTYPLPGEKLFDTAAKCRQGDLYLRGTLAGQLTVASAHDVIVTGSVLYRDGLAGQDILGIVADGFVKVYKALGCSVPAPDGYTCNNEQYVDLGRAVDSASSSLTIYAAIAANRHSFTAQQYTRGSALDVIRVVGGIYQKYRGPVGANPVNGGFRDKDYRHDRRLVYLTPPHFLDPVRAGWVVAATSAD